LSTLSRTRFDFIEPFPHSDLFVKHPRDRGSNLLIGEPGSGKTVMALHFINESLRKGRNCVYVHTTVPPEDIFRYASSLGFNFLAPYKEGRLLLVDAFSHYAGLPTFTKFNLKLGGTPSELSFLITSVIEGMSNFSFVFDDLSGVLADAPPDAVQKFVHGIAGRIKDANALGLWLLTSGILQPRVENLLMTGFDGVFQLKLHDTGGSMKRYFRIVSLKAVAHRTNWSEMKITKGGIEFSVVFHTGKPGE